MTSPFRPPSKKACKTVNLLGLIVIFFGFAVIAGWHLQDWGVISPINFIVSMQYNCGLGFMIAGIAFLLNVHGYRKQALPFSISVLAIGTITLLQYIIGTSLGIDQLFMKALDLSGKNPGRMPPNAALCFTLIGVGLILMSFNVVSTRRQILIRLSGVIPIAFNVVTLATYFIGVEAAPYWAEFTQLNPRTSLEFFIISAALITYGWTFLKTYDEVLPPALPLPTTLGVIFAAFFLWQALNGQELMQFNRVNLGEAEHVKSTLSTYLDHKVESLVNMGKRWEKRGGTPQTEWENDAISYIDAHSGLRAIEWADSTFHVRWVVPFAGNEAVQNLNIMLDDKRAESIQKIKELKTPSTSAVLNLVQGGKGFLVYIPLHQNNAFEGFIVGAFDVTALINGLLNEVTLSDYSVSIFEGEKEIFHENQGLIIDENVQPAKVQLDFYENRWTIQLKAREGLVAEYNSSLPELSLFLGLFVACAVYFGVYFAQKSFYHSKSLETALGDLSESKRKTEVILHSMAEGVFGINETGNISFVNPAAAKLMDYDVKELVGMTYTEVFKITSEIGNQTPIKKTLETGRIHSGEHELLRNREDQTFPIELTAAPILKDGEVVGAVMVFRDITSRIESETKVKEAQLRLRSIIDNATSMIYLKDLKGKYIEVNKYFLDSYSFTEEDVIGKTDHDLCDREYAEIYRSNEREVIAKKDAITYEEEAFFNNEEHTFISVKFPLYDAEDQMYAVCGIATDITDRKASEVKLLTFLEQLEKANEELRESRIKAEEASVAKSAFLANMSHEIRTPLNGIIGMTSLLGNTEMTAKQEKYAQRINLSGKILLEIINDILDFSKIEAGELQLEEIPCDLNSLIKELGDLMYSRASEKGLELFLNFSPDAPTHIIGDPTRIRQILTNLIGNAIKFTQEGYIQLNVVKSDTKGLRIEVKDTGIGVPQEKLDTLFEKFSQADVSTTRKFGGTGLGLAISKQLVDLMNGEIGCTSVDGEGSVFYIDVPFKIDESAETIPSQIEGYSDTPILIVDDMEPSTKILEAYIKNLGMEPKICSTKDQALSLLIEAKQQGKPYKMALVDFHKEPQKGLDFGTDINSNPNLSETQLIFLSSDQINSEEMEKYGYSAFLSKPVYSREIIDLIKNVLS